MLCFLSLFWSESHVFGEKISSGKLRIFFSRKPLKNSVTIKFLLKKLIHLRKCFECILKLKTKMRQRSSHGMQTNSGHLNCSVNVKQLACSGTI